eukprot:159820-Chlamydomonas_euryale.AAC.11
MSVARPPARLSAPTPFLGPLRPNRPPRAAASSECRLQCARKTAVDTETTMAQPAPKAARRTRRPRRAPRATCSAKCHVSAPARHTLHAWIAPCLPACEHARYFSEQQLLPILPPVRALSSIPLWTHGSERGKTRRSESAEKAPSRKAWLPLSPPSLDHEAQTRLSFSDENRVRGGGLTSVHVADLGSDSADAAAVEVASCDGAGNPASEEAGAPDCRE